MYLAHYGLAEPPFRITPHTDFFFSGAKRGATLDALLYAIIHDEGIVKISGEVGSGKTMLCRVLMERLPASVAIVYLANPSLSREDILHAIADELGIETPAGSRAATVMRALQEKLVALYSEGKQVVVLIDEAHAMPMETLEEIRLLSNLESNRHKLLQLVLFGQPELNETLARTDMRQLRERITHHFHLEPLLTEDIAQYLDFRMRAAGYHGPDVFTPTAVKRIAKVSAGLTRRINILADKALLASFAQGSHQVGKPEVEAAIKDAEYETRPISRQTPLDKRTLGIVAGTASVLVAAFVAWQLSRPAGIATAVDPDPPRVEAIPAAPPPATVAETSGKSETLPADSAPVAPPPLPPQGRTPLLDQLLAESQAWLETVSDDRWFIQLLTTIDAGNPEQIESFLGTVRAAGLEMSLVRIYTLNTQNKVRHGVIYGDFASRKDAARAADALPAELRRYRPYARQAIRLKPEDMRMNKG